MYYNMKLWGREKDKVSGRLPLCTAAERCLTWVDMQKIFSVNMPAIHEVDGMTGLPVFMLAAAGPTSDIEAVYNLLREYPPAIVGVMSNSHPNTSTGTVQKRGQDTFVKKKIQKDEISKYECIVIHKHT